MADFWHASIASAFRKGDASWVDAIPDVPAAIAVFDDKMHYLAVSRRFPSDYELGAPAQVIGRSLYATFPDMPPRRREIHCRVLAGEELASEDDFFPRQDGRIQWARWSIKPWRTADGPIGGAPLYAEQITDQVAAGRALTDCETQFQVTFEKAPIGIAHVAPDGRLLRINEAARRMLGYSADELTTKSLRDITLLDDLPASAAPFELMRDGRIDRYDVEKRYLRRNGSTIWARASVSCVRKSDRSIDYIILVIEDISARKQAEEELRQSEEQFRSLLLASPLPIALHDQEQILAISESWLEETGYSREELRRLEDWTTRAYQERSGDVLKYLRGITSTERQGKLCDEQTVRTKDGSERLWRFFRAAVGIQSDGRRLFISLAYDVSDQSKAYENQFFFLLRESNDRAKNMLSLVQAIARETAARQPEDFIGRFNERIQALAASQDLLIRNEWRGAYVEDLA